MNKDQTLPFVIGHRGACGHAPENTLPSFEKAAALGTRWVEFDVKLSADGIPFLMHDDALDRTTDGTGTTRDLIWAELAILDAGAWFDPAYAGTPLLGLKDAIGHLDVLGLGANVEIKPCPGRAGETARVVCRMLADHWPKTLPAPVISSFEFECVEIARDLLPDVRRAVLFDTLPDDWRDLCETTRASAVHLSERGIDPETIRPVLEAGYPVRSYTVNERARAEALKAAGVTAIFTDFPQRMSGLDG